MHRFSDSDVAPDGSPVAVYRALPAEPEFSPVLDALTPPATVLDLGCGTGRLANELVRRGFHVTGVDASAEMLHHVAPGVQTHCGDIHRLDLGCRFDVVVLASHFVNSADGSAVRELLSVCARHVKADGKVFVERYDPEWARNVTSASGTAGDVRVEFRVRARRGDEFDAVVEYRLGSVTWEQAFTSRVVDDQALADLISGAGLKVLDRLSTDWVVATPAT